MPGHDLLAFWSQVTMFVERREAYRRSKLERLRSKIEPALLKRHKARGSKETGPITIKKFNISISLI